MRSLPVPLSASFAKTLFQLLRRRQRWILTSRRNLVFRDLLGWTLRVRWLREASIAPSRQFFRGLLLRYRRQFHLAYSNVWREWISRGMLTLRWNRWSHGKTEIPHTRLQCYLRQQAGLKKENNIVRKNIAYFSNVLKTWNIDLLQEGVTRFW